MNPLLAATQAPPVMEARRWLEGVSFGPERPLINVSQAAPVDPPPLAMREALARAALDDAAAHLYGPVLGLPALRAQLAGRWSVDYGGRVDTDQVAITSGCNQAFAAAMATLAAPGDAVMLPVPWYFNHKMWLDMAGVETRLLPTGDDLIPDPDLAARRIDARVRAIALVSPNNPGGVEYPAETLKAFLDLARERRIALVIDETYRDFHSCPGAPHGLFADPDWDDTLIQLYSFSKAYRLTGHRVGAVVASPARLAQIEKFLDTVAICPGQLGQRAALWGMENLGQWLAGERAEILARRAALDAGFSAVPGWRLLGSGAYFGYVEHPFDAPSDQVARDLVRAAGVLALPGTMFAPTRDKGGDGGAERQMRIAFANIDRDGIAVLLARLAGVTL